MLAQRKSEVSKTVVGGFVHWVRIPPLRYKSELMALAGGLCRAATVPRVRQSGTEPARHGRISKQGPGNSRGLLVEAAWHAARTTGPLRAFHQRIAARRGANVATVAVARKLALIAWHMLSRDEDYAFARPSLVREKLRRLELMLGASRQQGKKLTAAGRSFATVEGRRLEKELAAQQEAAYLRLVSDRKANRPKAGAGATPGRASQKPSKGKAARQTH